MVKLEISLNYEGVGQILKGPEVEEMLGQAASEICSRAGSGYQTDTYMAGTRYIASVYTEDKACINDNLDNAALLECL